MSDTAWVEFSTVRQKRKRAALACEVCHGKKIRCDLQARSTQGHDTCTNCASTGKSCHVRHPKRDKMRNVSNAGQSQPLTPPGDNSAISSINPLETGLGRPTPDANILLSSATSSTITATHQIAGGSSKRNVPQANASRQTHIDRPAASVNGISPSALSDRYTVDPGFLHVYGPENENDARVQALTSRKEPNLGNLSQPDLQQSFAETFFEYCYPWCPVLDKSSLSTDLAKSPLLDDALGLVGSHVQPPMIPHAGPSSYYDRARRKFYEDEEPDLMTSLRAVLLFYWWAPRPPSMVHRHSSWWWTSVVIRHCQQAGFDHESEPDYIYTNPTADMGLRRRIWWTAFVSLTSET